jgi:hypothetical protein
MASLGELKDTKYRLMVGLVGKLTASFNNVINPFSRPLELGALRWKYSG